MDTIQSFLPYFYEQAAALLKEAEQYKIILSFNDGQIIDDSHSVDIANVCINKGLLPTLSNRQQDCAYLLLQGMSAKAIARELNLSVRTVEDYLRQLKSRLQCRNKTELILKLLR